MKKQRVFSILLSAAMLASLLPSTALAASVNDFQDVPKNAWYREHVKFVVDKGYFAGTSNTTFGPDVEMSRGMFVTVLSHIDGATVNNNAAPFDDVPAGKWYSGAVKWAVDSGIIGGYGDGKFGPNDPITREQMCSIIERFISYYEKKTNQTHAKVEDFVHFKDADEISVYFRDAVKMCQQCGLISGYPDGRFGPKDVATRAQVAVVIHQLAWITNPDNNGGIGGGGGGGGGGGPVAATYTINYVDGTQNIGTATATENVSFSLKDALTKPGFMFINWNTRADGTGTAYAPGEKIFVTKNMTLYAQWLSENDYIAKGVQGAMEVANGYITKFNDLGSYDAPQASAKLEPVAFSAVIAPSDTRAQKLTGAVSVTDDLAVQIIDKASTVVAVMMTDGKDAAKDEVKDVVNGIANKFTSVTGIVLKDQTVEQIEASVKAKVKNMAAQLQGQFLHEGKYVTGDVFVKAGNGAEYKVLTVTDNSASRALTKDQAIDMGVDFAKEMYASLRANGSDYKSVINVEGTLTARFTDNAATYGAVTAGYPHAYPVTIGMKLDGGELLSYKCVGEENFVKLNVTADIQKAYEDAVADVAKSALSNAEIKQELSDKGYGKLVGNQVITSIKNALAQSGSAVDVDAELRAAVDEWTAANLQTVNFSTSYQLPYQFFWENSGVLVKEGNEWVAKVGNTTVKLGNNVALHDLVLNLSDELAAFAAKQAVAEMDKITIAPAPGLTLDQQKLSVLNAGISTELAKEKYDKIPTQVKNYLNNLVVVKAVPMVDFKDPNKILNEYKPVIESQKPAVFDMVDKLVLEMMSTYQSSIDKALKAKDLQSAKDISLANLVTLLRDTRFQNRLPAANSYVEKLGKVIAKLPANASVEMCGVTLNSASLSAVRSAKNTTELCNAVANLLDNPTFKSMSIEKFAEPGQQAVVTYKGHDVKVNLVVDIH